MLRMVGFGDNVGSGFPTILNAWKEQGWETPELIEDTVLNQVSLILKTKKAANKSVEKKAANKSGEKKLSKKTEENINILLDSMSPDTWYKLSDFEEIIDLKPTRLRELLTALLQQNKIEATGNTKGKMYRRL